MIPALHHSYAQALPDMVQAIDPEPVAAPRLVFWNAELAQTLGFSGEPKDHLGFVSGQRMPDGVQPVAQAYSGHQFGHFNPGLGDGRAHLLGEIETPQGLFDLTLKGSGRTAFSRGGDGRAGLGPMLREVLVSECLHALGIPTTRALSVVTTGDVVHRQQPEPGAILARTAASHIRVGTFEHLAHRQRFNELETLAHLTQARHYPEVAKGDWMALLQAVMARQIALVARWMGVGFIHGVMNTDNTTLSGESIDFGPCAFMETFERDAVFSSIDRQGRYAYNQQPAIVLWNLTRFAETLLPLMGDDWDQSANQAREVLDTFEAQFKQAHTQVFLSKLGLTEAPEGFVNDWLDWLAQHAPDFTRAHAALGDDWLSEFGHLDGAQDWFARWRSLGPKTPENPWVIARNQPTHNALKAAEGGNLEPFEALLQAVQRPFEPNSAFDRPGDSAFMASFRTFCGT